MLTKYILFNMMILYFLGSYFCYDNPAALQSQIQRVSYQV
jgi:hypothetical protein